MKPHRTHWHSTYRLILISLWLLLGMAPAWADGTLTHMSGTVSVQKPDGATLPGTAGTKVSVGDTVVTGPGSYARMEMTDGGEMVLRPESRLKVEGYRFVEVKPTEDNFVFSMLKGGLRTVTGLIGKRGNKDAYELKTTTATIGIRGTQFDLRVCQANCGALADGTYLAVRFGAVQTSNAQGTLAVAAGQVAHVPPQRPPVILPRDPGIGFTPPAVIPKLDEKKKVQAAATAAAATSPDQPKPAASGSGQATQTKQTSGQAEADKKDDSSKTESSGKKEVAGSGSSTESKEGDKPKTGSSSGTNAGGTANATEPTTRSTSGSGEGEKPSQGTGGTSQSQGPSVSSPSAEMSSGQPTTSESAKPTTTQQNAQTTQSTQATQLSASLTQQSSGPECSVQ